MTNLLEATKNFLRLLAKAETSANPKKYTVTANNVGQASLDKIYLSGRYKKAVLDSTFEECFKNFFQGTFINNKRHHALQDDNSKNLVNGFACQPINDVVIVYVIIGSTVTILYIGNHSNNPFYHM